MKKILSLLLVLILSLGVITACGDNETTGSTGASSENTDNGNDTVNSSVTSSTNQPNNGNENDTDNKEKTNIKLSVLNGTTGFGMVQLMYLNERGTASNNYEFKVETDATNIVAALISGSIDMAALPTNAAANVYNKSGGKVQVLAINTLGVLYLLQKDDQINSIADLKNTNKKIYVPAQNPRFITEYILSAYGISTDKIDSTTYSTPAALQQAVVAGQVELAVLPQPVVTAAVSGAKSAGFSYNIALDLTAEWNKIPGSEQLVQGCLVVRKDFAENNPVAIEAFLNEYEASIKFVNENPKNASQLVEKYNIFAKAAIAEKAIPYCNITFMKGEEMKASMSAFIAAMYGINSASVGGKLPGNDFYYVK